MFSVNIAGNFAATLPTVGRGANVENAILREFSTEAAKLVKHALEAVLGTTEAYVLAPSYAEIKPQLPGYNHIPGKSPDQPLILTAAMFNSIEWVQEGTETIVYFNLDDIPDDFDYTAYWEKVTSFMEKAMSHCEDQLADLLIRIIVQEMQL